MARSRSNGIQFGEYATPIPNHEQYTRVDQRTGSGVLTSWSITSHIPVYEPNRDISAASRPVLQPNPSDMRSILLQRLAKIGKPVNAKKLKRMMDDAGMTDTDSQLAMTLLAQARGLLQDEEDENAAIKEDMVRTRFNQRLAEARKRLRDEDAMTFPTGVTREDEEDAAAYFKRREAEYTKREEDAARKVAKYAKP